MADTTEKKPKGCLKGCLTVFVVFVLVIIAGIVGGRMYFNNLIPDPVEYEASDVDSFFDKANINSEDYKFSIGDLFIGNLLGEGEVEVDAVFTSEEVTAFLQSKDEDIALLEENEYALTSFENLLTLPLLTVMDGTKSEISGSFFLTDFNVKTIGENRVEIYANVSDNLDPVYEVIPSLESYRSIVNRAASSLLYVKLEIVHSSGSGFDITMMEIRANGIPVPQRFLDAYQDDLNRVVNREVNNAKILEVHSFKIDEDGIHFIGILPEKLKSLEN